MEDLKIPNEYFPSKLISPECIPLGIIPKEYTSFDIEQSKEFEVIQINWYYRHQKRIIKISKEGYSRLDPVTRNVRIEHKFIDISKISLDKNNVLIIYFNSNQSPEYYIPKNLNEFINAFISKGISIIYLS